METGVIKFAAKRISPTASAFLALDELNRCREKLLKAGLLGRDNNGIGFGNVSVRCSAEAGFHITASGLGDRAILDANDVVQVTGWDLLRNQAEFRGASNPSSESLTHAAIYDADDCVHAVIHAHDLPLWQRLLAAGQATPGSAEYGTPAMAEAVKEFVIARKGQELLFAMKGHDGGLICCGSKLDAICARLLEGKK